MSAKNIFYLVFFGSSILLCSCKEFIDVELPNSKVSSSIVFGDDNTATSAMIGVYYDIATSMVSIGEVNSMSRLASLSSDELVDYQGREGIVDFEKNQLTESNINVLNLWNSLYKIIYDVNSIIEGLDDSRNLSQSVKSQLLGEAKFLRAFCNFYLVNFYGPVPIVNTSDYRSNVSVYRDSVGEVYNQIVKDLSEAKKTLGNDYVYSERIRPNSYSASALLSKVFLFLKKYDLAEAEASLVINNSQYEIVEDLSQVFLKDSKEAIWQIAPLDIYNNTDEALYYVITEAPNFLVLRDSFVAGFDPSDYRLQNWVGVVIDGQKNVYYPNKYKLQQFGLPTAEYSIVMRLAEVYLIRSESRARLNELGESVSDLDVIRKRAGLSLISEAVPNIDKESLLLLIENEKKVELFTEWGNRWFDLKRLSKSEDVLMDIKPSFTLSDELFPIPQIERYRNPNLDPQNTGY
jgi:starch-binding outer membrane protein, SusD/RagB family